MKKLLAAMLIMLLMLSSAIGTAEGPQSNKSITFSGYDFGSLFKTVRKQTRLFCIDFLYGNHNSRVVSDALDDFAERENAIQARTVPSCFFARPSGIISRVAGHDVETELWFVYPFQNGIWNFDEDEAIFYAGVYEFSTYDDLKALYPELKDKMTALYGECYYAGDSLDGVLGHLPFSVSNARGYNDDRTKFDMEYTVWKSRANGAYAVMSFWYDTNQTQYKLRLAYVSDLADAHFASMAELGVFSEGSSASGTGMEGL